MKSDGEIKQKLKQVLFRHQKRLLKANFKKVPGGCRHNADVELDVDGSVCVCVYHLDGTPRGVVCDPRLDGNEQARNCPLWEPLQTKDEIKEAFQEMFETTDDLGPIAAEFPDVAALLWVLGQGTEGEESPDEPDGPLTKGWNWRQWPWTKE